MTLAIIFGGLILIGIGIIIWHRLSNNYDDWPVILSFIIIFTSALIFLINAVCWIPHKKDNQILLEQLAQEKYVIEKILETGTDFDKIMLRQEIIDYNNRIIKIKINSERFIFKDYYDRNVDWDALELIDWKN